MTLRPRKLDIFIAKQFLLLFVGAFFICQFVLMMQFMFIRIDDLIGKGLSMEVLAQFFWHMGLMMVPQALPLAILLSSLITFGNLGENTELTAIKAAGISLMKAFRAPIFLVTLIACCSFYFQNNIGPKANLKMAQLLMSMRQKSPELEIPEGKFYDGIPNCNLYVQKRDLESGHLYGMMIYRMTGSYEDQAIILADSGMLQATAEKKHLLLTLWNGEWFENMKSQELTASANVPYRRETFYKKEILLDFDGDFNLTDASLFSNIAKGKSLAQLTHSIDSVNERYDSIGRSFYDEMKQTTFKLPVAPTVSTTKHKTLKSKAITKDVTDFDSIFAKLSLEKKKSIVAKSNADVTMATNDLDFRQLVTSDADSILRSHRLERIAKFTLALSCLVFFFVGAPLGAIIRKGGLGLPVIISVLVFIAYYILDNSGVRMAKIGEWNLWFGALLSICTMTPLAIWVTIKANNDSVVFNMDLYKEFFMKLLGLRLHRHVMGKEVIIEDPDYEKDKELLEEISKEIEAYAASHRLRFAPNVIKVFFKYEPDHVIEGINDKLETIIEDLGNSNNKYIVYQLNNYPILSTKAHTRPFDRLWLNVMSAIFFPLGVVLYIRMWRFRIRLYRDLNMITKTNTEIIRLINKYNKV